MSERTFVMVKPDGVSRALLGRIITLLEEKGLTLRALKFILVTEELARLQYEEHEGKSFYPGLVRFIQSGPVAVMCWEGQGAVSQVRTLVGATHPKDAAPGSIRGMWGVDISGNLVHASDSQESAERELGIFFGVDEIISDWQRADANWLFEE